MSHPGSTETATADVPAPQLEEPAMLEVQPRSLDGPDRTTAFVILGAVLAMFLAGVAARQYADPDMFHEMALFREAVNLGHLPHEDRFAYTPTVSPSVHHEWGTGALLYLLSTRAGDVGVMALRYALALGMAVGCYLCARRRGASLAVLAPLLPVTIFLSGSAFSPVRAQMFTLLMLAWLLYFLTLDGAGRRWWIAPWLAMYVLWVNLHAGFVVGLIFVGLHGLEQIVRRKPFAHLVAVGLAMLALVPVNPYGWSYYPYLWHAVRMDRPLITEWQPIWHGWPPAVALFAFSLLIIGYAALRVGPRRLPGLILVLVTAYAAIRHQRHLSLYALAWTCYVPAYVQLTPLGEALRAVVITRRRAVLTAWAVMGVICAAAFLYHRPWHVRVPVNEGQHQLAYPVGPVDYLREVGFRGNVMTAFPIGAFVSWKLYPDVKVSLDGRYEVAYPLHLLEEHMLFYAAEPGWREVLEKYPTDAVLVPAQKPIADALDAAPQWPRVYVDDMYAVHARRELTLPTVDRRGETLVGRFP